MQMSLNKHSPSSLLIGKAVAPMLSDVDTLSLCTFSHSLTLICVSLASAGSFLKMTCMIEVIVDARLLQNSVRIHSWTYLLTRWPPNKPLNFFFLDQFMFIKRRKRCSTRSSVVFSSSTAPTNTPDFIFVHTHPHLHANNGRYLQGETDLWARVRTLAHVPKA